MPCSCPWNLPTDPEPAMDALARWIYPLICLLSLLLVIATAAIDHPGPTRRQCRRAGGPDAADAGRSAQRRVVGVARLAAAVEGGRIGPVECGALADALDQIGLAIASRPKATALGPPRSSSAEALSGSRPSLAMTAPPKASRITGSNRPAPWCSRRHRKATPRRPSSRATCVNSACGSGRPCRARRRAAPDARRPAPRPRPRSPRRRSPAAAACGSRSGRRRRRCADCCGPAGTGRSGSRWPRGSPRRRSRRAGRSQRLAVAATMPGSSFRASARGVT